MPVNDYILIRRGTTSEWEVANPILASGEPGYDTEKYQLKVGDGASAWNSLNVVGSRLDNLLIKGTGVSLSGHQHIASNITDFNSTVSGLLPVKNIVAGSNVSIQSNSGIFTISASVSGSGGGGGSDTLYIGDGSSTVISYPSTSALNIIGSGSTAVAYNDTNNTISISSPVAIRGYEIVTSEKSIFSTSASYISGNLDVYYNGFKLLANDDYTANGGSSFTLTNAANNGDIVEWIGASIYPISYAPISHSHSSTDIIFVSGTPSSASASGTTGQILWDNNYVYVCIGSNSWKRASLNSW